MPSSRKWLHYGGGDCNKPRSVAVTTSSRCTAAASPCGGGGGGGGGATQQGPQGPQGAAGDAEAAIYGNEVQPYCCGATTSLPVIATAVVTQWFGDAQTPASLTFTASAFTMTRAGRLSSFWSAVETIALVFAGTGTPTISVGVWKAEPGDAPLLIASRPLPSAGSALPMATVVGESNLDALLMPGDRVAMGITMTGGTTGISQWSWTSVSGSVLV